MITYKIIDLFAGIGGIRLAFEQAASNLQIGLQCVFTSEIDKYCQDSYIANFGNTDIYGDISSIDPVDVPSHDILLAGFPCQPFSQAGLKNGFNDTRGTLFFNIEQIINHKKPKAFLLENVKHLKGHDKGKTFKIIIQSLELLGYKVYHTILNAKDFGLPQNRERLFIVGFLDNNLTFNFPTACKTQTKIGNILVETIDDKYVISDKLWAGHQRRKQEHKQKGNGFGYVLFSKESAYVNTLSARYYKDGSEILIDRGVGLNPRKLTPRECARLQGFPDSFIIKVSDIQAYKQFGNSVPINVINKVAYAMFLAIKGRKCN
jgi:DNA (cytosine-5)-methyltransferase 1